MTRAERRFKDKTKALRKKAISDAWMWSDHSYYDNLHQYSKNKIHCSCPYCSVKTNEWFGKSKNWKHSDLIKIFRLEEQLKECA